MKQVMSKWWRRYWAEVLVVGMMVGAAMVFGVISVVNHQRLMTFGWDLGFYDQLTYQLSRGEWPVSTFFENKPTLAIRFSPILVLLAPMYWVWADARVLLIVQAVLAAVGAWPLYKLANQKPKTKKIGQSGVHFGEANRLLGVVVVAAYLSFIGLQRAVFFDFHPDVVMVFLTGWLLYFVEKGEERKALAAAVLLMLCKEWAGLLVAGIGVMFLINQKPKTKNQKLWGGSWKLILMGLVGFVVTIYGVAKPLAGTDTSVFGYGPVGRTPVEVMVTAVTKPWVVMRELVWPVVKLKTVLGSLASVGFLPLLAPASLVPIAVQLAVRFLDGGHRQAWTLNYHYSATLTPLLVYGALKGIKNQKPKTKNQKLLIWWLMVWAVGGMVYFHAPVFTILKADFYQDPEWLTNDRQVLEMIPKNAAVAAQNNLVPQLSTREKVYVLPKVADAEYVIVDFRSGQSSYNFSTGTEEEIRRLVGELVEEGEFEVVVERGAAKLLRRLE